MIDIDLWNRRRKELKLSLYDIAEATQIGISTIKDIFRGKRPTPRIDTVEAIEKVLGITREPPQPPPKTGQISTSSPASGVSLTEKETRLLRAFSELVDEMQDYIIESTETLAAKQRELRGGSSAAKPAKRA